MRRVGLGHNVEAVSAAAGTDSALTFIGSSGLDPVICGCRAKKAADIAVAAAKDAIAQAAGEEQPEGGEEEMIDVAAATDAPSMEEVSTSVTHPSSVSVHPPLHLYSLAPAWAARCAGGSTGCGSCRGARGSRCRSKATVQEGRGARGGRCRSKATIQEGQEESRQGSCSQGAG